MSHPYAGADDFPASITLNDDGVDAPQFTNFNTPSEGLGDRTAYTFKRVRSLNWLPSYLPNPSNGGPIVTVCAIGYDQLTQKWLIGGHPGGEDFISTGYGDASGWVGLATVGGGLLASGTFRCIIRGNEPSLSPASKYIYTPYVQPPNSKIQLMRIDTNASSASLVTSPIGAATTAVDCQMVSVSGVIVAAVSATVAAQSQLYFSSNSGSTWTAQSAITISSALSYWLLAVNPSNQIVAIPGLSQPTYITSTNGTSWTAQAGLNGISAAETVTTLVWGDDGTGLGCWVLTTVGTGASSGVVKVYISYDGANWSTVTNDLPNIPSGFFYMGYISDARILVGMLDEGPPARVVYSLNGGAHWSSCRLEIPTVTTVSAYPTSFRLLGSPNQAAIVSGALLFLSTAIGDPGGVGLA